MADPQVPGPDMIVLGSSTRDVVLAAGKVMGKSAAQMQPYVAYLLREEWLETCLDLRETSADRDAWANLKIPARLKLKIKQIVQAAPEGDDTPDTPDPAPVSTGAAARQEPVSSPADNTTSRGVWAERRVPPLRVAGLPGAHEGDAVSPTDLPSARNPTLNTPPASGRGTFSNPDNPSPSVPASRPAGTGTIVTSPVLSASAAPARADEFELASPSAPPSAAWRMAIDPSTQLPYFYNTVTGESQWETPEELASPTRSADAAGGTAFPDDTQEDAAAAAAYQPATYSETYVEDPSGAEDTHTGGRNGMETSPELQTAAGRLEPRAPQGPPPHLRHLVAGADDHGNGAPSPIVSSGFGFGHRTTESDALIAKATADFEAAVAASLRHDSAVATRNAVRAQQWFRDATGRRDRTGSEYSTDSKGEEAVVADVVAQPQQSLRKWQCMVCTFLNQARSQRCAMCSAKQPELEAAMRPASELITTGVPLGQFRSAAFSFARHKR